MKANAKADTNSVLLHQWERRQTRNSMLMRIAERRAGQQGDMELVGMLVVFGLLLTAILLAIWLPGK